MTARAENPASLFFLCIYLSFPTLVIGNPELFLFCSRAILSRFFLAASPGGMRCRRYNCCQIPLLCKPVLSLSKGMTEHILG